MANIPISDRSQREFGRMIAHLLQLHDMQQKELARRTEISNQRVSQIIAGDVPSPEIVRRMADAFNVSYFELWYQAYHEIIPDGYEVVPADPEERQHETLYRFRAEHPEFSRLYDNYMSLPEDERDYAIQILESLFSGWQVRR